MINYSELLAFGKTWHITETVTAQNGDQTIYFGKTASPSGGTSAASWCIKKVTLVGSSNGSVQTITEQYADGNTQFDNIWDNRTQLNYSYLI